MKVQNMTNDKGRAVPNQFILTDGEKVEYFQSYDSILARREYVPGGRKVYLDEKYWDYSKTTGKYRNQFLGESIAETRKKIASGEYILCDLN